MAVAPMQREQIVEAEAEAQRPGRRAIARETGHEKTQPRDQSAPFVQQSLALAHGLKRQFDFTLFEIAQPAVHQLGRARRRAGGEIARFDQQGAQTGARRLAQDARAGDTAADDNQIPFSIKL